MDEKLSLSFPSNENKNLAWLEGLFLKAAAQGDVPVIIYTLAQGVDVNTKNPYTGEGALAAAATHGQLDAVKILLNHPALDINARSYGGNTALMDAAWSGQAEASELLLADQRTDRAAQNYQRRDAAQIAHVQGHKSLAVRIEKALPRRLRSLPFARE